jgi:hypothetical protein
VSVNASKILQELLSWLALWRLS